MKFDSVRIKSPPQDPVKWGVPEFAKTIRPVLSQSGAFAKKEGEPLNAFMVDGPKRFTYYKCDGFEVWGKEYRSSTGRAMWRLRVFSDQDRKIETYDELTEAAPEGKRSGESKAMQEAIAAWLAPINNRQETDRSQSSFLLQQYHNTPQILATMTVLEAAVLWDDPRAVHLRRWAQTFGIPLLEFDSSHIATYERERLGEVNEALVLTEILALRALLKQAGVGEQIESLYMTPLQKVALTTEELDRLSPRARAYTEYLEKEISSLKASNDRMKGKLRQLKSGKKS